MLSSLVKATMHPSATITATHTKVSTAAIIPCGLNFSDFLPGCTMNCQNFRTDIPTKANKIRTTLEIYTDLRGISATQVVVSQYGRLGYTSSHVTQASSYRIGRCGFSWKHVTHSLPFQYMFVSLCAIAQVVHSLFSVAGSPSGQNSRQWA